MNPHKITLYALKLILSLGLSLFFTYLYGHFFQHERYWKGTIENIQKTEISIINSFLNLEGVGLTLSANKNELPKIFDVVKGKLSVTVLSNDALIYTNRIDSYSLQDATQIINPKESELSFKIDRYEPPLWKNNFLSWLKQPNKWTTPRFDYITIPFVGLFFIFWAFLYALIWRYRSSHLSKDVLVMLKKVEGNKE